MAIIRLGDVCDVFIGKTPSTKEPKFWDEKFVKFLDGSLNDNRYISSYAVEKNRSKLTKKDKGFLMTILGNLYFKFSNEIYSFNQQVAYIEIKSNSILPKYLYYKFNFEKNKIEKYMFGTTVKHLNKTIIENIVVSIPSLEEQRKIIDIIEPFEKYIDLINNINNKIKHIILNQFQLLKKENISLNQFENIDGYAFSSEDFYINGKYKIFKIRNIISTNSFDKTNLKIEKCFLKKSDVVTGLSGSLGTSKIITKNNEYLLNQRCLSIRSEIPLIVSEVINKNCLNLLNLSTGSVQKNITKKDIANLKFDSRLDNVFNKELSNYYVKINSKKEVVDKILSNIINKCIK